MSDNTSTVEDDMEELVFASDKFSEIEPDGPLFFEVTFYKKFEMLKNPKTGKFVELDLVTCFEFPQFACLLEKDSILEKDTWKSEILEEFVDYLKFKAASFANAIVEKSRPIWVNDVTVRFSVT